MGKSNRGKITKSREQRQHVTAQREQQRAQERREQREQLEQRRREAVASKPSPAPHPHSQPPAAPSTSTNRQRTKPKPNTVDVRQSRRDQRYSGPAANRPAPPPASAHLPQLAALARLHGLRVWRLDDTGRLAPYDGPVDPVVNWRALRERL